MYKRTVKCYQCKFEKTDKCNSCDEAYSNLEMRDEFKYTLTKKTPIPLTDKSVSILGGIL